MKKRIACLAVLTAAVCIFTGCSTNIDKESETQLTEQAQVQTTQSTIQKTTQPETEQSIQENAAESYFADPDYVLPEEDAEKIAFEALKQECKNNTFSDNIDDFTFDSIKRCEIRESYGAFNRGNDISAYNTSSHPYYAVKYNDNSFPGNYAYFCIDLRNGDLLYTGYMGD